MATPEDQPVASSAYVAESNSDYEIRNDVVIHHVYGGGGKGGTPVERSFIELYNVTDDTIDLSRYTLTYSCAREQDFNGDHLGSTHDPITGEVKTVEYPLSGEMSPGGSFLIVGQKEAVDGDLTFLLPTEDMYLNGLYIDNDNYILSILKDGLFIGQVETAKKPVSGQYDSDKKFSLRMNPDEIMDYAYGKSDTDALYDEVNWSESDGDIIDTAYIMAHSPKNSAGEIGTKSTGDETYFNAVETSDKKVDGFFNGVDGHLDMTIFARYNAQAMSGDGGAAEIVSYVNGFAYVISGLKGTLDVIDMTQIPEGATVENLSGVEVDLVGLLDRANLQDFTYGDTTSIAISKDKKTLAISFQDAEFNKPGAVGIFSILETGDLSFEQAYRVGVQPDMVTFASDTIVLTANEGEPRNGYDNEDPNGSVSILNLETGVCKDATFDHFTTEELLAKNILLTKFDITSDELTGGDQAAVVTPSKDLEPEYIVVSQDGKTAYVSLQEANALAILDVDAQEFTDIISFGFEDHSKVAIDLVEDGTYKPSTYENLIGARMPDAIDIYEHDGKTYILTANEGDSRGYGSNPYKYSNELKLDIGDASSVETIDRDFVAGLPEGKTVLFGGRSVTMFEITADGLKEVFTSADDFERIIADTLGDHFNYSNDDLATDSRSTKKGPEPETVVVGSIGDKSYAFVAIERIGGIMAYDITNPEDVKFANYINSREFDMPIQGDVSPEGLFFAEDADGNSMLLVANEVSGTVTAIALTDNSTDDSTNSGGSNAGGSNAGGSNSGNTGSTSAPVVDDTDAEVEEDTTTNADTMTDVSSSDWYYDAVNFVLAEGLFTGVTETEFQPESKMSRAMLWTVLYRYHGGTGLTTGEHWYSAAQERAVLTGISDGSDPHGDTTREQLATILYRFAEATALEDSALDSYPDSQQVSAWAVDALNWAATQGLIQGDAAGHLNPTNTATRGEVATILMRYLLA